MDIDIGYVEANDDSAIKALLPIIKKHFDFERDMILKRDGKIHQFLEDFEESKDYYFTLDHLVATCPSGDIIGILSYDPLEKETFISVMYVEESVRRQGIGKVLFEKLKEMRGKREDFALGVDIDNAEGIGFYQSLGFIKTLVTMNYVAPEVNNVREVVALKFGVTYPNTGNTYIFNETVKDNLRQSLDSMIKEKNVGIITSIQRLAREKNVSGWPTVGKLLSYRFIDEETSEPKLLVTIDFTDEAIEKLGDPDYEISPYSIGVIDYVDVERSFTLIELKNLDIAIIEVNSETEKQINDASGEWYVNDFFKSLKNAWDTGKSTTIVFESKDSTDKEIKNKIYYFPDFSTNNVERVKNEIVSFLLLEKAKLMKIASCYTSHGYRISVDYVDFRTIH